MERRVEIWRRLAADLKPAKLRDVTRAIGLDELPSVFETLLKGNARGRYVVRL